VGPEYLKGQLARRVEEFEYGVLQKRNLQRCLRTRCCLPFWPPVPSPRLMPQLPTDGGVVGFPLQGGVWAE
jgi:hypothetical protein